MSSAPRSAGTESLSAFREELQKRLPRDPREDVRARVFDTLVDGETLTIGEIAERAGVTAADVLDVLGMSPDTHADQTLRLNISRPAPAKPGAAPKKPRSAKR